MSTQPLGLPADRRAHLGGMLFLASLVVFFLASIVVYLMYAYTRRNEVELATKLPGSFLFSTSCLVVVSYLLHLAQSAARRERRTRMISFLVISLIAGLGFMVIQLLSMGEIINSPKFPINPHRGVVGMVVVLAVLHALHVLGGVIALALVTARACLGRYDHERYWAVSFTAQYWHFLDVVWICMLTAFWMTSGGFAI